ncbi:S8 family serine peptidase [Haloterrigena salinisoli]|uniref:S8 family serine peptidase n=1 Tax=Haloterrigena salinisoli TaxID=3132747 RepID=UPI00387E5844
MYGFSIGCRRLLVLSLVALLCTSLLFPIGLAAGAAPIEGVTATDDANTQPPINGTTSVERSEPARIDPTLEDADGVVEVIVRLESSRTATTVSGEVKPTTLQAATDGTQSSLEHAAETTAGLDIERQFWLANAALVSVDTDRVSLETVGAIDGVVEIHADAAVELASGAATDGSSNATASPGIETSANALSTASNASSTAEPATNGSSPADPTTTATVGFGNEYTYGLERLSVPATRERYGARGDGATVAVLDTGVDDSHPDVTVDAWRDFSGGSSTPMDYNDHGTHVAGTIVGGDASGTQIGVAPEADLLAGAVLTDCTGGSCVGYTSDVIDGMEWAIENGADVISLSLGSEGYTSTYVRAVRNAEASGTVVVAGAGNGGDGVSSSPGNVYDAISVGATDENERVADFSSGAVVDTRDAWGWHAPSEWPSSYVVPTVTAPGERVLSASPDGGYVRKSGTSMATPHVAGVVALVQGATDRHLEPAEIRAALTETATKPRSGSDDQDTRYGHGIVDAVAALEEAGSFATVEGTVTDTVTDEPIAEATVTLESADGAVSETTTDLSGRYELEGITGDREYTLTVAANGYETTAQTSFVPADETTTVDVSLAGDGELEVTLDDAQFGGGIANATVEATTWDGTYPVSHQGDGTYVAGNVPTRGEYTLTATAPGYHDRQRDVTMTKPGRRVTERLQLSGDATLEIATKDAVTGTAISNATVTIERSDGASLDVAEPTDSNGTIAVTVPGTDEEYTVCAEAEGYESETESSTVSSEETAVVEVPLDGDGALEVALEDAQFGDGISDATIEATGRRGTYSGVHTNQGTYRIAPLPGGDEYAVNVSAAGYVSETLSMESDSNETATERAILEGDATLSVSVVDEDGEPIDGATVTIERPDGTSFAVATETDSDGTLEVTVPGTGMEYTVGVDAEGYESETVTTGSVSSEANESVTVTMSAADDGVPGFGVTMGMIAVLATLAVGVTRTRR